MLSFGVEQARCGDFSLIDSPPIDDHPLMSTCPQIICCLVAGGAAGVSASRSDVKEMWFLQNEEDTAKPQHPALTAFLKFWSFVIIFTNFVPISLLVTLDLVKLLQSKVMSWDRGMYHEAIDFDGTRRPMPAQVSPAQRGPTKMPSCIKLGSIQNTSIDCARRYCGRSHHHRS